MPEYLSPGVYVEEQNTGTRLIEGVSTSTAGLVGQTRRGPTRPTLVTSWLEFTRRYGDLTDPEKQGYLSWGVHGFFANGGRRAYIARVVGPNARTAECRLTVGEGGGDKPEFSLKASGPGVWGNGLYVSIGKASQDRGAGARTADLFSLRIFYFEGAVPPLLIDPTNPANAGLPGFTAPSDQEFYDNLSPDPLSPSFAPTVVNAVSDLVRMSRLPAASKVPEPALPGVAVETPLNGGADPVHLENGADNGAPLTASDYSGDGDRPGTEPANRTGLAGLAAIRDIALLAVPDQDETRLPGITGMMVGQCERNRDRFCILQFPKSTPFSGLTPPMDSSYAAIYHPWLNVLTPDGGHVLPVPPAGHLAGLYARTDISRGVYKAPANEPLRGLLTQDVGAAGPVVTRVTTGEQDLLNPRGINCIRDFRYMGRDVRVWGARTLSSDSRWRYVNVRRLFIFVEQSIERGTQWVVFEPNDTYTWNRLVSSVSGFLNTLWHNGALLGATPQEAFFVRCDATTMTRDDIDNGRLVCNVGIAPVKPAEFVIFRFSQRTAGAAN